MNKFGGKFNDWCLRYLLWNCPWWRHQMETISTLLALCEGNSLTTSEFPSQRPVTQSFDVFFDLCLNKRLSKQSGGWWFETPSHPLWRHSNVHRSVSLDLTDDKSTFVQVMAWWLKATSHYPNECWHLWCHMASFCNYELNLFFVTSLIAHMYVVSIPKIMGTVNNTSNSGGREWKFIFDQ